MAYQVPSSKSPRPTSRPSTPTFDSQVIKSPKRSQQNPSWVKGLVTLVVIIVIIAGGIYLITDFAGISLTSRGVLDLKNDWQAVFLSNGQVYFGKITKIDENFINLENIYYLQVVNLQDTIAQPPDVQNQPEQRLTLIKLGNEIHGPRDAMIINSDHVVLIEDLKDDSRVVQAINDYISGRQDQ